jgi:hypothetical protein
MPLGFALRCLMEVVPRVLCLQTMRPGEEGEGGGKAAGHARLASGLILACHATTMMGPRPALVASSKTRPKWRNCWASQAWCCQGVAVLPTTGVVQRRGG